MCHWSSPHIVNHLQLTNMLTMHLMVTYTYCSKKHGFYHQKRSSCSYEVTGTTKQHLEMSVTKCQLTAMLLCFSTEHTSNFWLAESVQPDLVPHWTLIHWSRDICFDILSPRMEGSQSLSQNSSSVAQHIQWNYRKSKRSAETPEKTI